MAYSNSRGGSWWRSVARIGPGRARRIMAWLPATRPRSACTSRPTRTSSPSAEQAHRSHRSSASRFVRS
ncbi:phage integrase family protein [Paraburkholderia kururiensis]|uniref:phage integrase family protein n=1 Tax=Paraburkholderia kururiensis TaxID=984307 RepID=UPI001F0BA021|nr:phage integrase family protein [Paraburkholderia kururiensis]